MSDLAAPYAPRLLLVDGDRGVQRYAASALRRVVELVPATDARSARALLNEWHFDAVVSDLVLPDADGLALLAEAARLRPGTKLILYSASAPTLEATRAVERGVLTAALRKPEGIIELIALARGWASGGG